MPSVKAVVSVVVVSVCSAAIIACVAAADNQQAARHAYRSAVEGPPPGWKGPVFQLSHNYPAQKPGECPRTLCTWLATPIRLNTQNDTVSPDWENGAYKEYIREILDYVREGQDPNLANEVGFRVQVKGKTRWFHVPWMAYDPTAGREFVHGTTNERTAHVGDLVGDGVGFGMHKLAGTTASCAQRYPRGFESWSVGFYNEWGGWSIGQSFGRDGRPKIGSYLGTPMPAGLPFPEGTVVAKVLTTSAPVECVPFLKGAPEWQVNRHAFRGDSTGYVCEREVQTSRVVQLDVAVVDLRSPTRWVYGTFVYDGNIQAPNAWDRMVPLGLQWGTDPLAFPAVAKGESRAIVQSVINRSVGTYQHGGCNGRLAGPVDNPASSCVSCHASAFAAPNGAPSMMGTNTPPSFGFAGMCSVYSRDNTNYNQNIVPPMAYSGGQFPDAYSLDTSLQLAVAFTEFGYFNTQGKPQPCKNPNQM